MEQKAQARKARQAQQQRQHEQMALMGQEATDLEARLARLLAVHESHVGKMDRNQTARLKAVTTRLELLEKGQRRIEAQQNTMCEQMTGVVRLLEHTARMTALILKRTPRPLRRVATTRELLAVLVFWADERHEIT